MFFALICPIVPFHHVAEVVGSKLTHLMFAGGNSLHSQRSSVHFYMLFAAMPGGGGSRYKLFLDQSYLKSQQLYSGISDLQCESIFLKARVRTGSLTSP